MEKEPGFRENLWLHEVLKKSTGISLHQGLKWFMAILLITQFILVASEKIFSQSGSDVQAFGINAGAFTNFPANQDYLKDNMAVFYIAPYIQTGKHEFSAGFVFPLQTHGLFFSDDNIHPRLGAEAGYKFYIFDVYGRENLFVHYSFQYLRFMGSYDKYYQGTVQPYHFTETNVYINNVIGLGYNLFFDNNERFGFYYTLDYVISQAGYKIGTPKSNQNTWTTQFVWNNISTNIGFSFKLGSLKKKDKK